MAASNSTPAPAAGLEHVLVTEAKLRGVRVHFNTRRRRAGEPYVELFGDRHQLLETFRTVSATLRWLRPGGPSHD